MVNKEEENFYERYDLSLQIIRREGVLTKLIEKSPVIW